MILLLPHWEREGAGSAAEGFLLKPWLHTEKNPHKPTIYHDPKRSSTLHLDKNPEKTKPR